MTAEEFNLGALKETIKMPQLQKKGNKDEDIKEPGKWETGT